MNVSLRHRLSWEHCWNDLWKQEESLPVSSFPCRLEGLGMRMAQQHPVVHGNTNTGTNSVQVTATLLVVQLVQHGHRSCSHLADTSTDSVDRLHILPTTVEASTQAMEGQKDHNFTTKASFCTITICLSQCMVAWTQQYGDSASTCFMNSKEHHNLCRGAQTVCLESSYA